MTRASHLFTLRNRANASNAKRLRSGMTEAEWHLWYHLRAGRFEGYKFRRQVPIGDYIVDFLCEEARVIVEVDGGQHTDLASEDAARTRRLRSLGYEVVRFWNNDVLGNIAGVLETLSPALSQGRGRKS